MFRFVIIESTLSTTEWFIDAADEDEALQVWEEELELDVALESSRFERGKTRVVHSEISLREEVVPRSNPASR
jgi:hypothetical protein